VTARSEATAYAEGAESRKNTFRVRQSHELLGTIALKEKKYDEALTELAKANQQDPQVIYLTAVAWRGKGDEAKAKEYAAKAANANVLPLMTYAFIRTEAKRMS
jgi:uncharacterized protein HemY